VKTELLDRCISNVILLHKEKNYDVDGAPYKIGQKVKVLNNPSNDETFDKNFVNEVGEVIFFEYNCGCGQSFPGDPMIGVEFQMGKKKNFGKKNWN